MKPVKFGQIIKNALCPGGNAFVSVAACESTGNNNDFIKTLHAATGAVVYSSRARHVESGSVKSLARGN